MAQRLIDADIIIKDLTAMKSIYDAISLDGMIKALKEAPTIDPVKQEWISVKDDMPKEHDSIFARFYGTEKWRTGMYRKVSNDVIACLEHKNGYKMVKVLSTQDGDWDVSSIFQAEVTHWMPLPEPPEGMESE